MNPSSLKSQCLPVTFPLPWRFESRLRYPAMKIDFCFIWYKQNPHEILFSMALLLFFSLDLIKTLKAQPTATIKTKHHCFFIETPHPNVFQTDKPHLQWHSSKEFRVQGRIQRRRHPFGPMALPSPARSPANMEESWPKRLKTHRKHEENHRKLEEQMEVNWVT